MKKNLLFIFIIIVTLFGCSNKNIQPEILQWERNYIGKADIKEAKYGISDHKIGKNVEEIRKGYEWKNQEGDFEKVKNWKIKKEFTISFPVKHDEFLIWKQVKSIKDEYISKFVKKEIANCSEIKIDLVNMETEMFFYNLKDGSKASITTFITNLAGRSNGYIQFSYYD